MHSWQICWVIKGFCGYHRDSWITHFVVMCLVFAVLCHFGLLWRHAVLTTKNLVATVVSTGSLYPLFECEGGMGGGGGGHVSEHVCM